MGCPSDKINLVRYHITRGYVIDGWHMCETLKTEPAEWIDRKECEEHFEELGLKEPYHVSEYRISLKDAVKCHTALDYLKRDEWEMGNGQCGECQGLYPQGWPTDKKVGHKLTCSKAKAIEELGGEVFWYGDNPYLDQELIDARTAWRSKVFKNFKPN